MNQTLEFIHNLYGSIDSGYLVIWRKDTRHSYYLPVNQLAALLPPLVAEVAPAADLYFGLGIQPRVNAAGRGVEADVTAIPGVWVDIDCSFGSHSLTSLPGSLEEIDALLADYPAPTYVIASGGGYHIYWLFSAPLVFDDTREAKALVQGFQRGIRDRFAAAGYKLDATHDLARVLRIPGTFNHKGAAPAPVTIARQTDYRYSVEELAAFCVEPAKPASSKGKGKRRLAPDEAREMLGYIPAKLEYTQWLSVLMALYSEFGADTGATLAEEWSPGYPGEVADKMASFEGRGYEVTAGTLVYYARLHGWKPANFEYEPIPITHEQDQKYVTFSLEDGPLLLVKSQKGTGKTEQLASIVADARLAGKRVLLVGHRIALLQSTARRLGLSFYLEEEDLPGRQMLAITLDSLYKLPPNSRYDLIILDESEQVLAHATGATLRDTRALCLNLFRSFLSRAANIVALDADMGPITYRYFERELEGRGITVINNAYRPADRTFVMYNKKASFIHSLIGAARRGERLFIAANSRQAVDTLARMLDDKATGYTYRVITSANSMGDEAQELLTHINERVTEYYALLVSPSVGTGVSIDTLYYDRVYLLGEADITTHLDLLQQAGRVRNIISGQVHAWINDKVGYSPVNPDYLSDSALLSAEYTAKQIGIQLGISGEEYAPRSDDDSRYLALWADVQAIRNASLNNLRAAFIAQIDADGYQWLYVPDLADDSLRAVREDYKEASNEVKHEWATAVATAADLDYLEYKALKDAHRTSPAEKAAVTKYEITSFYGVAPAAVTPEIVLADDKGLRGKVIALALLTDDIEVVYNLDALDYRRGLLIPDRGFYTAAKRLRLEGLQRAGIDNVLTHRGPINPGEPFITWAVENKQRIYSSLRIRVRADIHDKPRKLVSAILEQLGLKLKGRAISVGKGKGRRVVWEYELDADAVATMVALVSGYKNTKAAYANPLWEAGSGGQNQE